MYLVTSLALSSNPEAVTGLGPSDALLEPHHGAPRHPDRQDHADQEHRVGGHQAGGVLGAGALAVQQSQARDQHVGADNPQGVQTVSCINNFLCFTFTLKSFHEIIPESMLAKKMTPQAVLRRIMQRVMMLDTMKKL